MQTTTDHPPEIRSEMLQIGRRVDENRCPMCGEPVSWQGNYGYCRTRGCKYRRFYFREIHRETEQ